jgi:class I fructose-bisphosphate aldolase
VSSLGKQVRLNRIFSDPSGRILSVALDHLINYPSAMPMGLRRLGPSLEKIVEGRPSAVTINKGTAMRLYQTGAGKVPLIIQSTALRPGLEFFAATASPEEVIGLGGDAIAVAMFVKGPAELRYIHHLTSVVGEAERLGLPVIPHVYPLSSGSEKLAVTHTPEDIHYAVRIALESGADVIKVPYTGDAASFGDIVSLTPVPVVTAGGPKCATLDDAVEMVASVVESGAAGSTVGRNVWEFEDIPAAIARLKEAMFGGGP